MSTEPGERRRRRAAAQTPADMDDADPFASSRYTWKHYLVLAAVACVLGSVIWSFTTSTGGSGAQGAGAADPTMSSSAPPSAPRGEL